MLVTIIIFIVAVIIAFSMLLFRAWEIRTQQVKTPSEVEHPLPDLAFRHIEKNMLYLTKHIVQNAVLIVVKYWFIFVTKARKKIADNWPKINAYLEKKPESPESAKKTSFFRKAILESEAKIKRIKEKVEQENE